MKLTDLTIGFALTGSFCTYENIFKEMQKLIEKNINIIPIFSNNAQSIDCRFGKAADFIKQAEQLTGNQAVCTIEAAEPLGPKGKLDLLLIAPCTGNTIGKLANAITDTPVLMAAKGHLRNGKPLVISLSTNDALSMNFKNIGLLLNMKNIYFVPFGQDNYKNKPYSMISHTDLILPTLENALDGIQLQPVIQSPF